MVTKIYVVSTLRLPQIFEYTLLKETDKNLVVSEYGRPKYIRKDATEWYTDKSLALKATENHRIEFIRKLEDQLSQLREETGIFVVPSEKYVGKIILE